MEKPIITFARFGNYTVAFKTLFEQLGLEVIPPGKTTPQTIAEGAKIAPEMFCFPMKVTIGNYLPALKKGANTIFMVQNVGGSCRQRYYGAVQEKLLKDYGFKINFLDFRATPKDIYSKVKEVTGASLWQILRVAKFFFKKVSLIEKIEKLAQYYRPREIEKGMTDRILDEAIEEIEKLREEKEFPILKKKILKKFSQIRIEKNKDLPKVGLIGEIYTVCDPDVNFGVEKKLGKEGIEVHREMSILYHLKKLIFPWKDWIIQRKINPYLKSTVGGHGRDAIYEMLNYIKEDFDGIVHLLPFSCFTGDTNITVKNYLQKPIREVKVGEKVLTHKGRFKKVTQTFCRNYKGRILKVDCREKLKISLTPNHPILLIKRKEKESPSFIQAADAKIEDFVILPQNKKILNKNRLRKIKNSGNYFLVPIREIKVTNFRGKVYNLEVEDDHSYVANFLAVHNCMPEITVRPILEKLHQESGIPFLSLSLDEQVAEAGIDTRIEAFVDVVKNYFEKKRKKDKINLKIF